ncbi:MAG: hypothetical protein ACI4HO_08620 [Ruminococcus sp.]
MTLDEAAKAAVQRLPVVCDGITYTRILRTGYRYDEQGHWFPFVDLVSACGHSLTSSDPKWVKLAQDKEA